MRKTATGPEPEVLTTNKASWTSEYQAWIDGGKIGSEPTRYRHDEIRAGLVDETCSKCLYCEGLISHVAHSHVEHLIAKSARPDLVVEWTNLTIACPRCNTYKGSYHDPTAPLLNPYVDDPSLEVQFIGPLVRADGTGTGYRTIARLKLNRDELVLDRIRVLKNVEDLLRHAETLKDDPAARDFILDEVRELAKPNAEYSAAVASYLIHCGVAA